MSRIHPTAFVDPQAELAADVTVGPFCYIGPGVVVGAGCVLHSHVTLTGPLEIGPENTFHSQSVIGAAPQDLKYKGGPTRVVIGRGNLFRELVTVHRGTEVDRHSGGVTRIGDNNLLMVGVHIAHDAQIDDHVILANFVQVAGHVHIESCVNVGGISAMHHFVTVGRYAFVGGMTRLTADVPPYMKVSGYEALVRGVNAEGMRRWKLPDDSVTAMKGAYRLLFARRAQRQAGQTLAALTELESNGAMQDQHVRYLVEFIRRQMQDGVFGRSLERARADRPEDRAHFYQAAEPGGSDGSEKHE